MTDKFVVWEVDNKDEAIEASYYAENEVSYHRMPIHIVDRVYQFRYYVIPYEDEFAAK